MPWFLHDQGVLLHQGLGLDAFNHLPARRALHALFECCNSVTMAGDLARGRPYPDRDDLYRRADALLFALSEESIDDILQSCREIGARPGSARSHAEHCALWDSRPGVMQLLDSSARGYAESFGFAFVMYVEPDCPVSAVIAAIVDRMHNDSETERKVLRNEIARVNRSRLERMLGPAGGFDNWA